MKRIKWIAVVCLLLAAMPSWAQTKLSDLGGARMRVIIDNDLNGDPDGLFQVVQHLMSPSVEIRGIIGGHLGKNGRGFSDDGSGQPCAVQAVTKGKEILEIMGMKDAIPVVVGAIEPMAKADEAVDSEGAQLIIKEAMREDVKTPLYVVCGASLTNIASAWLLEPKIAERLTVIWIGGQEYANGSIVPPGYSMPEYNLNLDIPAGQTVFNLSNLKLWQVPRDAYRQCMYGMAELILDVEPCGKIGQYLADSLTTIMKRFGRFRPMGETYILGDSPLVLLTALQSGFESDPASCHYTLQIAPKIANDGSYRFNPDGRTIRVYDWLDTRLMFNDMVAKLKLWNRQ